MIIPRFTPRQITFHELGEKEQEAFLAFAEPIKQGALEEWPNLSRKLPHLACVVRAPGQPTLMHICENWEDVEIIQGTSLFNEPIVTTTWFAIGDWNAI